MEIRHRVLQRTRQPEKEREKRKKSERAREGKKKGTGKGKKKSYPTLGKRAGFPESQHEKMCWRKGRPPRETQKGGKKGTPLEKKKKPCLLPQEKTQ